MIDFSTLSTHNTCIPTLKPEKDTPFRHSASVKATIENTSHPLPLEEISLPV